MSDWKSRAKPVSDWKSRATAIAPEDVEQSMPEWLSVKDRAVAKLANTPQDQVNYLKNKYPDANFELDQDGNVIAYKSGDAKKGVLDPNDSLFSMSTLKDLPNDLVTDNLYDITSGIGQGLATELGAKLGMAGGPLGAVVGGMAAGGISGAALNRGKQLLAQELGVPQETNVTDDVVSGLFGAVMPAAFGTKQTKGVVQKSAEYLKDNVYPKVAQFAGGIPQFATKSYMKFKDFIDDPANKNFYPYVSEEFDKFKTGMGQQQTKLGKGVEDSIQALNSPVNISEAKQAFTNRILALEKKTDLTNAEQAEIDSLKNLYTKYFGTPEVAGAKASILPDDLEGVRAFDLQKKLKQAANFEGEITPENLAARGSARDSYFKINDAFNKQGPAVQQAKGNYENFTGMRDALSGLEKSPQSFYNNLTNLGQGSKLELQGVLDDLAKSGGPTVVEPAEKMTAFKFFGDPGYNAISGGGTTSTSRSVLAGELGADAGALAANAINPSYTAVKAGGMIGRLGGNYMFSPSAIKKQLNLMEAIGRANQKYKGVPAMLAPTLDDYFMTKSANEP